MKRLFAVLLAMFVLLAAGCGGGNEEKKDAPAEPKQESADKVGALMPIGLDEEGYKRWTESIAEVEGRPAGYTAPRTVVFFDNLNSMVSALKSEQINRFATAKVVGNYIVARNDDLKLIDDNFKPILGYSMAMMEKSADQIAEINTAITAMKEDGTLAKLIKENISDLAGADPAPVALPVIEGAPTLRVAVTGDMPAMDCILADGTPAGFNVAFLSELSNRINKNIELVSIESAARGSALSSGQVDALFWVIGTYDQEGNALPYPLDSMKGVSISLPYLMDSRVGVAHK